MTIVRKTRAFYVDEIDTWGRFHQLSTYSFYAQGAQMREKDSQVVSIFTLSGSTSVKAERKCVGEIDTRSTCCFTPHESMSSSSFAEMESGIESSMMRRSGKASSILLA